MKKKVISTLMGLVLVLSMTTAALADTTVEPDTNGDPSPSSGETAVTLDVEPGYTVTIPATVELEEQSGSETTYENDLEVTADAGVRLDEGMQITVTMSGDSWDGSSFYLTADTAADYQLAYTVEVDGTEIENDGVVAEFVTSESEQTSTLHFAAGNPTYAGSYSDTVTFTLAVEAAD